MGRIKANSLSSGISPGVALELHKLADARHAQWVRGLFQTGKGEYAHGDIFIGVRTPSIRKLAWGNLNLGKRELKGLIRSKIHEERLLGLLILVEKYKLAEQNKDREGELAIYHLYCQHFPWVNNWDLVDVTCPHIVGKFLYQHRQERNILLDWAQSSHLWTRRIAIVSNWWFIRKGDLSMVFRVAAHLLRDDHHLIHKAVGWMLREAGKKDRKRAENFLNRHCQSMPRVMVRYAIERYPQKLRKKYLYR